MTIGEARTEFLQRKKDTSDIDNISGTFLKWANYVNRYAYKVLANIMPESFILEQTYNFAPGTIKYTLPTDFQDIIPQGTGLYKVNAAGVDTDMRMPISGFGSSRTGFYMDLTHIVLTPVPTESSTWKLRYIPLLDELTTDADEFVVPTRFSQYLMDAFDQCYAIWDEDQNAEVFNDERFINSMNQLVALINPVGQAVGLPDFTQSFQL